MKKWHIAVVAVVVIAVGLGALFGGRAWGASNSTADTNHEQPALEANGGRGLGDGSMPLDGRGGGRNGGNLVAGSIIAIDASSITVKTSDGSTKIILLSDSASITVVTEGSLSDLKTGENVVVTGTTNTDGTVTAINIRLGESSALGGVPQGAPATQ